MCAKLFAKYEDTTLSPAGDPQPITVYQASFPWLANADELEVAPASRTILGSIVLSSIGEEVTSV